MCIRDSCKGGESTAYTHAPNRETFDILIDEVPENFFPVAEYFGVTYLRGRPARGRRRAIPIRYDPELFVYFQLF